MTTCRCPTCNQPLAGVSGKLMITKSRTFAILGDEVFTVTETEGEILHILNRAFPGAVLQDDIRSRLPRTHSQKPMTRNCLKVFIHHLRSKLEAADIRITRDIDGYRLVLP